MALLETQTSICNKALALIGEEPINSMDDGSTKAARVCKQFFSLTLRTVLEEGKWPFATIEEVAERLDLPDYAKEQKYIYAIPATSALIAGVYSRCERKQLIRGIDWDIRYIPQIKASAIICNELSKINEDIEETIDQDEQIMIEYISETPQTMSYTGSFVRCLVAQLAADICMPITHDVNRWGAMMQYAAQAKQQALQQNLNEDGQDKMHWIDPITKSRGC